MSAFVVELHHINYLVQAAFTYGGQYMKINDKPVNSDTLDEWGAILLAENITSVQYRYPDCAYDDLPGPVPTPAAIDYTFPVYQMRTVILDPIIVLSAIRCLEYQSCEHPGWPTSDAKAFLDVLRLFAVGKLPGMDDAPWEICERQPKMNKRSTELTGFADPIHY